MKKGLILFFLLVLSSLSYGLETSCTSQSYNYNTIDNVTNLSNHELEQTGDRWWKKRRFVIKIVKKIFPKKLCFTGRSC